MDLCHVNSPTCTNIVKDTMNASSVLFGGPVLERTVCVNGFGQTENSWTFVRIKGECKTKVLSICLKNILLYVRTYV